MQASFNPTIRKQSLRIIFIALVLSLLGHLVLFFGFPFISFGTPPAISEDLIIKTELKVQPPKKIQMAKAPKQKVVAESNVSSAQDSQGVNAGEQGGSANQQGLAFKLPESGILYYDAYLDGKQLQTGEIDWIVEGNTYRLHIHIPYALLALLFLNLEERLTLMESPLQFIGPSGVRGHRAILVLIVMKREEGRCTFLKSLISPLPLFLEPKIALV